MADQTSTAIGAPGDTLPTLAITATQKTYDFTYTSGGRPINRVVSLHADVDWLVTTPGTTNYTLVAANQPYKVMLTLSTKTVYAKTVTSTGTLYAVVAR
jgi:hypothetical protein